MKKILGMLSLIAILTVSFTINAVANDVGNDFNVEYVISDSPEFVAVATLDGTNIFAVSVINLELDSVAVVGEDIILPDIVLSESDNKLFNVSENTENSIASLEDVDNANIVSGDSVIEFADFTKTHLPNEVGLFTEFENEYFSTTPNLNEYVSNYNDTYGYETPDILKEISSNVGKLTTFNI